MRTLTTLLLAGFGTTAALTLFAGQDAVATPATESAPAETRKYDVDLSHSNILFKVKHLGVSYQWGRFDDFSGSFTIDDDAAKSSVSITVKSTSVNSNNKDRDDHLRGPDFFSVKEFPEMSFTSTEVSKGEDGYTIVGDLTLHGVTKSVTMSAELVGEEDTRMGKRAGFEGTFEIDRQDFGIKTYAGAIGDDVTMTFAIEGTAAR